MAECGNAAATPPSGGATQNVLTFVLPATVEEHSVLLEQPTASQYPEWQT